MGGTDGTEGGVCGAAICHDHAHPGLSHDFLIRTRHETALVYNVHLVFVTWKYECMARIQSIEDKTVFEIFERCQSETWYPVLRRSFAG